MVVCGVLLLMLLLSFGDVVVDPRLLALRGSLLCKLTKCLGLVRFQLIPRMSHGMCVVLDLSRHEKILCVIKVWVNSAFAYSIMWFKQG